jgi:serine/threonine protein kinase
MIGETVSHYRILERIGQGGMGVVYRAEDTSLHRQVALKFLPPDTADDTISVQRLVREARAAATLNHPHICAIYEIGRHEGRPFIVMELIKGRTLRQVLDDGRVPIDELLALALQIADALDAAHAAGLVHRDIKPSNIVVTDRGQAKILDFGLAKAPPPAPDASTAAGAPGDLTAIGALVGTVPYMSPEQVRGEPLDERSDLFSLGIVLYEMATGRHPFGGAPGAVALSAIQREPPVPASRLVPDVPSDLERVIGRLL